MLGKDFWRIIRLIYIIVKVLLQADPSNGSQLPDIDEDKE